MNKISKFAVLSGVIGGSLVLSPTSFASENENAYNEGVGHVTVSETSSSNENVTLEAQMTDENGNLANAKLNAEVLVQIDKGYGDAFVISKVYAEENLSELKSITEVPEGDGGFTTLSTSSPTDASTASKWVGNVTGYVTIKYHIDKKSGLTDSKHMNSVTTSWDKSNGAFVSNRKLVVQQSGKSHWGSNYQNVSMTKYPTADYNQTFPIPSTWIPLWEGHQKATSTSKVVTNGLSFDLTVSCKIL